MREREQGDAHALTSHMTTHKFSSLPINRGSAPSATSISAHRGSISITLLIARTVCNATSALLLAPSVERKQLASIGTKGVTRRSPWFMLSIVFSSFSARTFVVWSPLCNAADTWSREIIDMTKTAPFPALIQGARGRTKRADCRLHFFL